jgi:hypothetical protein
MDNFIPAPARENFLDQETFEEALGFWQSRVGRLMGMRGVTRTGASPVSQETSKGSPQATSNQQNR